MSRFESHPLFPIESCHEAAPLLTDLFDGEADETAAARARAHLLSCEKCAQAWLEWNQTQRILQLQPVPAPPLTLLWRIVLAARLSTLKRRFFAEPQQSKAAGALYNAFEPHHAPATLREEILRATTRREGVAASKPRLAWRLKLTMPALATPALAMLFLLVTRETPTPEIPQSAPREATAAVAKTPRENRVLVTKRKVASSNAKAFSRDSKVLAVPREAVARAVRTLETPRVVRQISTPRADFSCVRRTSREIWEREPVATKARREARLVMVRGPEKSGNIGRRREPGSSGQSPVRLVLAPSTRETSGRLVAVVANEKLRPDSRSSQRIVMPTLSINAPVPRAAIVVAPSRVAPSRVAPSRPRLASRPTVSRHAERMNPSRPNLAQSGVVLASARLESEAWESDERIEEMQTVVAEFRETFADEETEDEFLDES